MNKSWKAALLKYGITIVIGLVFVFAYFALRVSGIQEILQQDTPTLYLWICDSFTVPGVVIIMMGCLVSLSNEGAFNGIGYCLSTAGRMLNPVTRGDLERYGDYLERKGSKKVKGYGFLYIVGGVFLAVAIVFMLLYNRAAV